MPNIDLNADVGELADESIDATMMTLIKSANVACGLHAGSTTIMQRTIRNAAKRSVRIGAHPGFDDRANFGRERHNLTGDEITGLIHYQLGACHAVARGEGQKVRYLKLHGALANMASEDVELARTCYSAALELYPQLVILYIAATAQQQAVEQLQAKGAAEIFSDRNYDEDGTLRDRGHGDASIHDPDEAAEKVIRMLTRQAIITLSGKEIPTRIDSICVHGDGDQAIAIAGRVKQALTEHGFAIQSFC